MKLVEDYVMLFSDKGLHQPLLSLEWHRWLAWVEKTTAHCWIQANILSFRIFL